MRVVSCSAAILTIAFASPAHGQGFEGVQEFKLTSDGKSAAVVQTHKGSRVKLDMSGMAALNGGKAAPQAQGSYVLIDWKSREMFMVMPSQRMYMAGNIDSMMARGQAMQSRFDPAKSKVTKTGKTETVAGLTCELWHSEAVVNEKVEQADFCITKGAGLMAPPGGAGRQGAMNPEITKLMKQGYGVVKMTRIVDGKPQPVIELVKSDRKKIPASELQVPEGLKRMDMGAMMGGGMGSRN